MEQEVKWGGGLKPEVRNRKTSKRTVGDGEWAEERGKRQKRRGTRQKYNHTWQERDEQLKGGTGKPTQN